jgi:ribonucleotide reductase beta subunit family protein with ferritin-like domain
MSIETKLSFKDFAACVALPVVSKFDARFSENAKLFWTAELTVTRINEDINQWPSLPEPLRNMLSAILHFLFAADAFAIEILDELVKEDLDMSARCLLKFHAMMEGEHAKAYGHLLRIPYAGQAYNLADIYNKTIHTPAVYLMINWGETYARKSMPLEDRIIGMICFEGIIFTPLFAPILALKSEGGILDTLSTINEFVIRDEYQHMLNIILMFLHFIECGRFKRPTNQHVHERIQEAVEVSTKLIQHMLPVDIPKYKMIKSVFIDYTKSVADKVLEMMGYPKFYNIQFIVPTYLTLKDMSQVTSLHSMRSSQYMLSLSNLNRSDLSDVLDVPLN